MKRSLLSLFLLCNLFAPAQVNAYAKVIAISGNVLTLSNVNQTFDTFLPGEQIIIIQMQGATISGTGNNSSFGTLNSLNAAGLYEVAYISAVNGGATSMTLTGAPANSYNVGGSVQIVSFPKFGVTDYTTVSNITGVSWDGSVGGVVAFYVSGNLNLAHNISADAIGFRGGTKAGQNGGSCENSTWITSSGDTRYANKGEGVYITTAAQAAGKAKAVNAGGGGIVHNGGGGGGGNLTGGGDGYYGYTGSGYCSSALSAGGQGGLAVASNISRIFMGGGGGGGQENNSVGSNGGRGGGIILIKCDSLKLGAPCSPQSISANGQAAQNTGNDGAGGAGAGGTIVLDCDYISSSSGFCVLSIASNGGTGGSVGNGSSHGAGGGGGQGAIYTTASAPFANTTFSTNNGAGGSANTSGAPTAGSGQGSNGSGINTGQGASPLPLQVLDLSATETAPREIELRWRTVTEHDVARFEVWHRYESGDWKLLASLDPQHTTAGIRHYVYRHFPVAYGINYYRVKQAALAGDDFWTQPVLAQVNSSKVKAMVVPNPAGNYCTLLFPAQMNTGRLKLTNSIGVELPVKIIGQDLNSLELDLRDLPPGLYFLSSEFIEARLIKNAE